MVAEHALHRDWEPGPGLQRKSEHQYFHLLPNMGDWEQEAEEAWDSFPVNPTPTMTHAAHPVTTEVPPGYDGSTKWFKYADAVEEWCDLTKVEARRRGPAIAAYLEGPPTHHKTSDSVEIQEMNSGVDKRVVSKRVVLAHVPPERKPERGYIQMFPRNEKPEGGYIRMFPTYKNRNEGTFAKTTLVRNRPSISQWWMSGKCEKDKKLEK